MGGATRWAVAASLVLVRAQQWPAELSDWSVCEATLGVNSLTDQQTIVELGSRYILDAPPSFLPAFSSWPLSTPNDTLTTATIFVHGLSGAANSYYCSGLAAALGAPGVDPATQLVVAPWFGSEQVTSDFWVGSGATDSLYWDSSRWLVGGNNSPGGAIPVKYSTSFDALDGVVAALLAAFPSLTRVSVAGFSAGGQLVSRYAFFQGQVEAPGVPPPIRFLVGDPGSYLYLDNTRPDPSCRPLNNTGAAWGCSVFGVPPEAADCPTYGA